MAMESPKGGMQRAISPVLVAAVAALLVAGLGAYGYNQMALPAPARAEVPERGWLEQKANECKGDFNRLIPEDQARVNKLTNNYGVIAMSKAYQSLRK